MQQATSIIEPVRERLDRVQQNLKGMADPRFQFLSQQLDHVFDSVGKKLRPAITLLTSSFYEHDPKVTEQMATAVELLHIATLIHDDTVDDSDIRRGKATLSSLWGRNVAVLVGDYIFAASATSVCDTGNIRVIRRFAETIMELSRGELHEMIESQSADQTMDQYLDRIYNKTASLFTTASESGAILSGAPEEIVTDLREYGYNLGLAFQIIDDILDFKGTEEEIGKPVGSDLAHGIMTLPAILATERFPDENAIKTYVENPEDEKSRERAMDLILNSSIIDESYSVAEQYTAKALRRLDRLPKDHYRASLEELVDYVLRRRS